ncbi:MAG: hypothetical protein Q4A88_06910 [Clostridia bacterium]|nr:hypothetical protein [Clostridia bacterium]
MNNTIPLVIGVTGHRNIRKEDRTALYAAVCAELNRLKERFLHSRLIMLNSLAEGADLLCAEAAKALSIPVIAALPMACSEYEKDFSGEALISFRSAYESTEERFVVPATEQENGADPREFAYRQAGIYVATHAHILLALWDGEKGTSGCGTAETVAFMREGSFRPARNPLLRKPGCVIHVFAPRTEEEAAQPAGTVRFLGDPKALEDILKSTDTFNRLATKQTGQTEKLLPPDEEPDAFSSRLEQLYGTADALSLRFGKRYRRLLAALAIISTILTVAFLLYDEAELHGMILVCGGMLLAAFLLLQFGTKSASHRRYLEYRTLAENLRVQIFLHLAGSGITVAAVLPWSEREETAWVAAALEVLVIGKPQRAPSPIRDCWVRAQRRYHSEAKKKSTRTAVGSGRIVTIATRMSITLYLAVLAFELLWGGLLPLPWSFAKTETIRTAAKLLLGSISAATLFIANYYGKLSLPRVVSDHEKMERLYESVDRKLDREGQTDELLMLLAREELIENANWCAYQRDNGIDFNL